MAARTEQMWAYNLDNNRDPGQVSKEIKAILNIDAPLEKRPALLAMCEAFYDLGDRKGFKLVRSTKNKSRKNIAAYVRNDLFGGGVEWHDLKTTWAKTNPGATGQHEPRSFVSFKLGEMQIICLHQAPPNIPNSKPAQQEGIDLLEKLMKPKPDANEFQTTRPRLAIGDYNKRKGEEGPGPSMLANRIDGKVHGNKIDTAVRRGKGSVDDVAYPEKVAGVVLKSDHGHAYRFAMTAPEESWNPG